MSDLHQQRYELNDDDESALAELGSSLIISHLDAMRIDTAISKMPSEKTEHLRKILRSKMVRFLNKDFPEPYEHRWY